MHQIHLSLLICQLQFICKHDLSIRFLLNGPGLVFISLSLLLCPDIPNLLSMLIFYVFNLVRSQPLEVVRNISVISQLTHCSIRIFSHYIAIIGSCNFSLVLSFLVIFPWIFSILFFLSQPLVLILHWFHHVVSFHSHFVLQHASHSVHCISLLSISSISN